MRIFAHFLKVAGVTAVIVTLKQTLNNVFLRKVLSTQLVDSFALVNR